MGASHRGGQTQTSIGKVGGADRGKTVTKPFVLDGLGLSLSEKQIPQVVENLGSGDKPRGALEMVALRVKQAL
jgi:hypothetical protein